MTSVLIKICTFVLMLSAFLVFIPKPGLAENPLADACKTAPDSPICQQAKAQGTKNPIAGPDGIISKAANIIALVAGIGAVIMILIGGFFYITSAGNAENAKMAKDRIVAALIGLVVVALAWAIVRLITDRVLQ